MNALFIGNSFTQRNNVPGMIAAMAAAKGTTLTHKLIQRGGASLKMHFNKDETRAAIAQGGWDWVVLQEQSTLPVKNGARFHENVRLFDAPIRDAGARMLLYMTWARSHAPESQALLTNGYRDIGNALGAAVAPAGVPWERVLAQPDAPALHDADGSHPNIAGSYLAACALYATMFDDTDIPAIDVKGLDPALATRLRAAAVDAMRDG